VQWEAVRYYVDPDPNSEAYPGCSDSDNFWTPECPASQECVTSSHSQRWVSPRRSKPPTWRVHERSCPQAGALGFCHYDASGGRARHASGWVLRSEALAAEAADELQVARHGGDAARVQGGEVRVGEQRHDVGLGRLLDRSDGGSLEPKCL